MVKMIIAFLSLFVIVFTSIDIFRRLTGKEKMEFISLAGYAFGIATFTSLIAVGIVLLF